LTVDTLLRLDNAGLEKLSLGGEKEAVVQNSAPIEGNKLVPESADLTV
jgi:hypothetical protein